MPQILDTSEMMFDALEPKQPQRFVMYIAGIPTAIIKAVDRPNQSSAKVTVPHINVEKYVKGKTRWNPVKVTVLDYIAPSSMQMVMEWTRLAHESVTGRNGYSDMYYKDVTIKVIGPPGDVVEEWTLKGAWIESFENGTLDWSSDGEAMVINMTLAYNYAILQY